VTSVPISFPALTGRTVTLTIDGVRDGKTLDYVSERPTTEPVGIAEIGIPGVAPTGLPVNTPTTCRSDLLTIDGTPIDLAVNGSVATAAHNGGLKISGCGNSAFGIRLSAGSHVVQTSPYLPSGLTVDALLLASSAGGGVLVPGTNGHVPTQPVPASPVATVHSQSPVSTTLSLHGDGKPFWLVLGQSLSSGWQATLADGHSLGAPQLIDGYANGWYVPAGAVTGSTTVTLNWAPQQRVNVAIAISTVTLAASIVLAVLPPGAFTRWWRRMMRRRRGSGGDGATAEGEAADQVAGPARHEDVGPALSFTSILTYANEPLSWPATVVAALLGGLVAGAVSAPLAALPTAALILLSCRLRRIRPVLVGAAVLLLAGVTAYTINAQVVHRYVSDINWPSNVPLGNSLAWMGLCVLGADALVELLRARGFRSDGVQHPVASTDDESD
jgi:hypothetical protein